MQRQFKKHEIVKNTRRDIFSIHDRKSWTEMNAMTAKDRTECNEEKLFLVEV